MNLFSTMCATIGFGCALNAQLTLTSADFANGGDEALVSTQLLYTGDFSSTGPNYTWDFSDLVPTGQTLQVFQPSSSITGIPAYIFGTIAPANYKATYFQETTIPLSQLSGVLPIQIDNIVQYSKVASSSVNSLGLSMSINGTAVPIKSDTIETRYALPLHFNDTYFSRGYTHLNMNPIIDAQWTQHRTRTTTADGWGQVITPFGNYAALRLRHVITESDSVYYNGNWIPIPVPATVEYEWWTNNVKVPLLKITTADIAGNEQITNVEYRDDVWLGIENASTIETTIFPNPSADLIQVKLSSTPEKIEIIDLAGKVVLTDSKPSIENSYSIASFNAGTYILKVISEGKVSQSTFIKK